MCAHYVATDDSTVRTGDELDHTVGCSHSQCFPVGPEKGLPYSYFETLCPCGFFRQSDACYFRRGEDRGWHHVELQGVGFPADMMEGAAPWNEAA